MKHRYRRVLYRSSAYGSARCHAQRDLRTQCDGNSRFAEQFNVATSHSSVRDSEPVAVGRGVPGTDSETGGLRHWTKDEFCHNCPPFEIPMPGLAIFGPSEIRTDVEYNVQGTRRIHRFRSSSRASLTESDS